jgi:putative ABC transport system ATP-binding protein
VSPYLPALGNVELPLRLTPLSPAKRREHAERALRVVGLEGRLHHLPSELSGGQQQRVAVARAFVTDPDLILADEPTGNLDATSADEILALLSLLSRKFGKTIVMVTHDPHAASYADAQFHLEKGNLLPAHPMAGLEAVADVRKQTAH